MPRALRAEAPLLLSMAILAAGWNGIVVGSGTTIDATDTVVRVIDGDTFVAHRLGRVRLADVDAPELGEPGGEEATEVLRSLVHLRVVFLDIDGLHETDRYGRTVAVVYVEHNETHLLNVNVALLEAGRVRVVDFPNEFDPDAWNRYVARPNGGSTVVQDAHRVVVLSVVAILVLASVGVYLLLRSPDPLRGGGNLEPRRLPPRRPG